VAARPKYPGELGKPIASRQFLAALRKAKVAGVPPKTIVDDELDRRLRLLLKHYGIKERRDCWKLLARRLASEHVPGFRFSAAGRPRTPERTTLSAILAMPTKRGRGQPQIWTPSLNWKLLTLVAEGRAVLKAKGEKPTNEAALEHWIRLTFRGWRSTQVKELAKDWAKRVSVARKSLREFESK
jgi:hypothetical protein